MPEVYNDETFEVSGIISENRLKRPRIARASKSECPFCEENEHLLETVYIKVEVEDEIIRVANNKYPVCGDGLEGSHDVIIDTKYHDKLPREYSLQHWIVLIRVLKERFIQLKSEDMSLIQIFKNSGKSAGASIMHQHWQIIALRDMPLTMSRHYQKMEKEIRTRHCPICDEKNTLLKYCLRTNGRWKLVVPTVQTVVRETWIVPTAHIRTIEQWSDEDFKQIAVLMKKVLDAYYKLMGEIDYNICIMTGAPQTESDYHCIIKILPRTGNFAGFELATGCMIHVLSPETFYKQVKNII